MGVNDRCEQMTAGMRKQADSLLRQAYFRGYKDGEMAAEARRPNKACGYAVDELVVLGLMCRSAGISEDELHDFVRNTERIWNTLTDLYADQANRAFKDALAEMGYEI